jgi:hypothetical protein
MLYVSASAPSITLFQVIQKHITTNTTSNILKTTRMQKPATEVRKKMVVIRLSAREYEGLHVLVGQTTERHVSAYLRKVILRKPVVVKYRNASADDFLRDMLQLRKELESVSGDFRDVVTKLLSLEKIPDFRSWLERYEGSKVAVEEKIEQMSNRMQQLYEQWLPK